MTYDIIGQKLTQNYDIIGQNYDIIVSTMISGVPRFQMSVWCAHKLPGSSVQIRVRLGPLTLLGLCGLQIKIIKIAVDSHVDAYRLVPKSTLGPASHFTLFLALISIEKIIYSQAAEPHRKSQNDEEIS